MSSMELHLEGENENRKAGMLISIIVHLLLLLFLFVPFFNHSIIPPGQMGILVQFGVVDAGDEESTESMASDQEITQETESSSSEEPQNEPQEEVATTKTAEESAPEDVVLDPQSDVPSQEEIEREKAAEEARKKAEEEAQKKKQFEERKKKFGDILAGGNTKGNNRGDEGDPSGDPERSALDDIAKGSGKVGGGLTNRGVVYEPTIQENSQQSGTVVIEICVDTEGKVVSAKFTQRGSTTTNKSLVDVAIAGSKKYQFTSSEIEKQCGTVTVNFIVK